MKTISISGVIGWDVTGNSIRWELKEAKGEDVRIEIASPGGYVYDGLEIFNLIKNYEGKTQTHIMGLAASMASYISLAGDKRTAESNAVYMIHNVWNIGVGDHNDFRKQADELEGLSNLLAKTYAKKSGKKLSEIRELMDNETFYYGDEMVKENFVDEIVKNDKKSNKKDSIQSATIEIKACFAKMKSQENIEDDLNKAVALLGIKKAVIKKIDKTEKTEKNVNNLPQIKGELKNKKGESMTLDELKRDQPELYNLVKEEGVKQERSRVTAHLVYGENSKNTEFCHECIKNGEEANDQVVFATYMTAQNNANDNDDRQKDDIPDLVPKNNLARNLDEAAKDLTEKVMAFSKKGAK